MFVTSNRIYKDAFATTIDDSGPNSLRTLFAKQPAEHLAPGQALFFEGDQAKHVFDVLEGTLRIYRIIADGRRVITGFLDAGDMVGVSLRGNYLYSAEAITSAKVRRLTRKTFDAAVSDSAELRPQVLAHVCDEMAAAQDQMVLLSSKNAEERVCTFLQKRLKRSIAEGAMQRIVDLPMTRQDMADYLGLTIETVSRTITKLAGKGIVAAAGRHSLQITKPSALAHLAGDGDEYEDSRRDFDGHGERRRH